MRRFLALMTVIWLMASMTMPSAMSASALACTRTSTVQVARAQDDCCDQVSPGSFCPMQHSAAAVDAISSSKAGQCRLCRPAPDVQVPVLTVIGALPSSQQNVAVNLVYSPLSAQSPVEPQSAAPSIPPPPPR